MNVHLRHCIIEDLHKNAKTRLSKYRGILADKTVVETNEQKIVKSAVPAFELVKDFAESGRWRHVSDEQIKRLHQKVTDSGKIIDDALSRIRMYSDLSDHLHQLKDILSSLGV